MSSGEIAQTVAYLLLVVFWISVCTITVYQAVFSTSDRMPNLDRRMPILLVLINVLLLTDSGYWAITNIARSLHYSPLEDALRNPWWVASVKLLTLGAGILFLFVLASRHFEQRYLAKFLDQTWDAIGILDTEGRVVLWNSGAERTFGWQREEVTGVHIRDFLVPKKLHEEIRRSRRPR